MSFLETPRFPDDIAYGSRGGPMYSTRLVRTASGYEQRNINWTYPLHKWDVAYGIKDDATWESLNEFFHAVSGMAHGFRIKDHRDYLSCDIGGTIAATDQSLGTGDGATLTWQLQKTYTKGALSRTRIIQKPVASTTLFAIAGVASTADWTIDTTTGIITIEDRIKTVTAATNASSAVLTVGSSHGIANGSSVILSGFAGGTWSTVNGNRYAVTASGATTITINLNSTGLGTYTGSSGTAKTAPQSGEAVTAGFEFDVPVRFDQDYLPATYHDRELHGIDVTVTEFRPS